MSPTQIALLKAAINAERAYLRSVLDGAPNPDLRGVEISSITGFRWRTAEALVQLGVAEIVHDGRHNQLYLGSYDPTKEL